VNSVLNALPKFTVSRIEIINRQTHGLHKINNPKRSFVLPHVPQPKPPKPPSSFSKFSGLVIALVGQAGLRIPKRLQGYVALKCWGSFNNFKDLQKVKVGWIVKVFVGQGTFITARFLEVNPETSLGAVVTNDITSKDLFRIGSTYPLFDGYWGERTELVLDSSRNWQRIEFQPRDGVLYHNDGRVEVIEGGWDHEHCSICWENISPDQPDNKYGYFDQNNDWVCQSCYEKYVIPKSLDFINLDNVF
jgi:hypothetical protein